MSGGKCRLSLVVAVSSNMGIGIDGKLPWKLKGDMAFFKRITTNTVDSNKMNAVIMGRKTWESIPSKFRPLPGRVNVVISRTMQPVASESSVHVVRGLTEAVSLLTADSLLEKTIENIFIIGGSTIYEMVLQSPYLYRIYLTEIMKEYQCDTFLSRLNYTQLKQIQLPDVPADPQIEENIRYKFIVYEKQNIIDGSTIAKDFVSIISDHSIVADTSLPLVTEGQPTNDHSNEKESFDLSKSAVSISVAVDMNLGFGKNGTLPWHLKTEYDHFISMVTKTDNPDKKVVFIKGHKTWDDTTLHERQLKNVINIVISSTLCSSPPPADVDRVVDSFEAALNAGQQLIADGSAEKMWILGGQSVYKAALDSGLCQRVHLTRIHMSYDCDVFFPAFHDNYRLIPCSQEFHTDPESQVEMTFEIYERI